MASPDTLHVLVIGLVLLLAAILGHFAIRLAAHLKWKSAPAVIEAVEIEETTETQMYGSMPVYFLAARYRYTFDGREFCGSRIFLDDEGNKYFNRWQASQAAQTLRKAKQAFVDAADPSQAVIVLGESRKTLAYLSVLAGSMLLLTSYVLARAFIIMARWIRRPTSRCSGHLTRHLLCCRKAGAASNAAELKRWAPLTERLRPA